MKKVRKRQPAKALTLNDERTLCDWTHRNRSFRDYVAILTILQTGLRNSELRALRVSDIAALPHELQDDFQDFLDWKLEHGEPTQPTSYLFASAKSPQITARHLQRIVRESTIQALGTAYSVDDLSKTFIIRERENANATLSEASSSGIEGRLLMLDDETGHVAVPVQAVRVDDSEVVATTLSDNRGRFRFTNLMPGQYKLRCQTRDSDVYYADGEVLQIKSNEVCKDINFRFPPFKQGTWKQYTVLDGLTYDGIQAILQTDDGALWFTTSGGGVSRYDGRRFVNFTAEDGLGDNRVWAIHQDRDGMLWFAAVPGISRYDGESFCDFTSELGLPHSIGVRTIDSDTDGVMWLGTNAGVFRYDGERLINLTTQDGLVHDDIRAVRCDTDGMVWFGTWGGGVSRYDGREFKNFTTQDGLVHDDIRAIHCDPDGMMWFGTVDGISRYDGERFINLTTKDGLAHNNIDSIHRDPDGVMWFGTYAGASRYDGERFINFAAEDGFTNATVRAIHRDVDGALWFGTWGDGAFRYDEKSISNLTPKNGLPRSHVVTIYQDMNDALWFGTYGGGVSRYDENGYVTFTTNDGLLNDYVLAIHQNADGIMWFGTTDLKDSSGVSCYDGKTSRKDRDSKQFVNFTPEDGLADGAVYDIHRQRDGTMWFATFCGVSRYDGEQFITFTQEDGLPSEIVHVIYESADGLLWFGTADGVSRYDGQRFANLGIEDGLVDKFVLDIYRDPDGVCWFGTSGGVSRYDGERFVNFTTKDGLAHNYVCHIHRSADGALWFATHGGGVSRYDGVTWTSLDTRDGLAGNHVFFIHEDDDGSLLFATSGGVTRYRRDTTPPRIEIVAVTANERHTNLQELPPITEGTRITFEYDSIDFKTHPDKRIYRCRLEGYETDWNPPTRGTQVDYVDLPVGKYTFLVQAIDRDGNYSEPAKLNITVQPNLEILALQTTVETLQREVGRKYDFDNIIGRSAAIKQVYVLMEKAVDSGLTVLITGDTGTGKELVAKAIHYNSPRKDKPLLEINCGAIPKELVASTLFGHQKGAFTGAHEDKMGLFESASGGTVVLDEIGEMPEDAQVHLLGVLQENRVQRLGEFRSRDVDARVIAITNRDLHKAVESGDFREDLYYRLNVIHIHIPALRVRLDDIPLLANHFLQKACGQLDKNLDDFSPDVFNMLQNYPWPGNIRELENEINRAAVFAEDGLCIQTYHFSPQVTRGESLIRDIESEGLGLSAAVERVQRRMIEDALRECDGNRTLVAQRLGIHRPNLTRLMKRLGIDGNEN